MNKRYLALLVPSLFLFDRASKIWASVALASRPGGVMDLISGVVRLRYVENDGAAFSMFAGNSLMLIGLTGAIMLGILLYLLFVRGASRGMYVSLCVVLSGGLGNLYDRIAYGRVIDYVEPLFVRFAIFNLADVFVVLGAIAFAVAWLRQKPAEGDAA